MRGMKVGGAFKWEVTRWIIIATGLVPGIIGIYVRYMVLRWMLLENKGFFRILERVIIEYPRRLKTGHDVGINTGCWINARGRISIGNNTIIGPYCIIHSANHRFERLDVPIQHQGFEKKSVHIGNNVWIGARVTILPGVKIGNNSIIGAGSVVTKNIEPDSVAVGNPARIIKKRHGH